jgi:hypothetical protein
MLQGGEDDITRDTGAGGGCLTAGEVFGAASGVAGIALDAMGSLGVDDAGG